MFEIKRNNDKYITSKKYVIETDFEVMPMDVGVLDRIGGVIFPHTVNDYTIAFDIAPSFNVDDVFENIEEIYTAFREFVEEWIL